MKLRILYFQTVRALVGVSEESLELPGVRSAADLREELARLHPPLAPLMPSLLFAVNEEHAGPDSALSDGDTVAVMPPFSGG